MQSILSKRFIALALIAFSLALFMPYSSSMAATAVTVSSPYVYNFNTEETLYEAGSMSDSGSGYWWVNSGARFIMSSSAGRTLHGSLPTTDSWNVLYNAANPVDTDNGTHPQNLFRLVSRNTWNNVHAESLYRIDKDNFSHSPNRNGSNGLLLMLRYTDAGQTLYYFGIRVDGYAVIKKKYKGAYYTVATKKIYPGTYVLGGTVNLLPHTAWLTLGAETVTNADGSATLRLLLKNPGETAFTKQLEVTDSGQFGGTPPIGSGYVGIRTDFMDVSFDNFKAIKI